MTRKPCPRLWQVEAVHDGRLAGSDLSNALRHRAECADCNQEARAFSELARQIKTIRVQPADPLQRRRTRQALLGAWNEQLLAAPEPKTKLRVVLIVAFCMVSALALAIGYPLARGRSQNSQQTAPSLSAQPTFQPMAGQSRQPEPNPKPAAAATPAAQPELVESPRTPAPAKTRGAQLQPSAARSAANSAEDDAYLQIVDLLRNGREAAARAKASQYLQRFPTGFRRVEVGSIASRPSATR